MRKKKFISFIYRAYIFEAQLIFKKHLHINHTLIKLANSIESFFFDQNKY